LYLPSKFIKPKFIVPISFFLILIIYFISAPLFRNAFVYFYSNIIVSKTRVFKKIDALKAENIRLLLENKRFNDLIQENKKLKKLLNFQKQHNIEIIPLNVVSIVPSRFRKAIIVDGGENIGIKKDIPILDDNGFMAGKVSKVYYDYSEITLVNDPDFYITVKINDNLGLLRGTLGDDLKVFYIDNKANVKSGDEVLALSYNTHSEFTVGKVKEAKDSQNSFFMDITVKPSSKPYPHKTVFAVR